MANSEIKKNLFSNNLHPYASFTSPIKGIHSEDSKFNNCFRKFPNKPFKILEAPGLEDDFYLNLIDWSQQDALGVGLENRLFFLRNCGEKVIKFKEFDRNESITSLAFNKEGTKILLGLLSGGVYILDTHKGKIIREYNNHLDKVSAMSWNNNWIFSTGSKDKIIYDIDMRSPEGFIL